MRSQSHMQIYTALKQYLLGLIKQGSSLWLASSTISAMVLEHIIQIAYNPDLIELDLTVGLNICNLVC